MAPRISVLLSTYNNRRFVAKKLAEIRRQTLFREAEFLFLETGSPERERELLAPFCLEHPNCRLITTDDRRTLYDAWNLGWDAAAAPLLCYSNMDDTMHPQLLETVAQTMEQRPWQVCTVLIGKQQADDPALDDWDPERLRRLPISLRPGPFTAWRRDLKPILGQFDGRFVAAGDLDFWSRIVAHRLRTGVIGRMLYLYSKSAQQLSKTPGSLRQREQDKQLLAGKPYPIGWSARVRWKIYFYRWMRRLAPRRVCLPPPGTA